MKGGWRTMILRVRDELDMGVSVVVGDMSLVLQG